MVGGGEPMPANRLLIAKGVVHTVCARLMMSAIGGTIAQAKVTRLALVDPNLSSAERANRTTIRQLP